MKEIASILGVAFVFAVFTLLTWAFLPRDR